MTLRRYGITFILTAALLSLLCSMLPVVKLAHVLVGAVVEEQWKHNFVLEAGGDQYFIVDAARKAELERTVAYVPTGAIKVVSANAQVTAKDITWSKSKSRSITAPGGELITSIRWEALPVGAEGNQGAIAVQMRPYTMRLKSGGFQVTDGRSLVREVTVHGNAFSLALGRLGFAVWLALPVTAMVHSIWLLCMLPGIRRARLAADAPPAEAPLPRTFSPNPVAGWQIWAILILCFGFTTTLIGTIAVLSGYFSSVMIWVVAGFLCGGAIIGLFVVWLVRRTFMCVRVDAESISCSKFTDGKKPVQALWKDVKSVSVKERTVKGVRNEWVEIVFPDGMARSFSASNLADYPAFRQVVETLYAHHHPAV